jgi:hypothetical protein
MRKRVGKSVHLHPNPADQRIHDISLIDPDVGSDHIRELAQLLKVR